MLSFFLLLFLSASQAIQKPPVLEVGDGIGIVAPAYWSPRVEETKKMLLQRGFKVYLAKNIYAHHGRFAGTDQERADAFMDMWKNKAVKALWCISGGYGSGRILDKLDYDFIKSHPKILLGMSDVTALHVAIGQRANLVTFLSPLARQTFEPHACDQQTASYLWMQILNTTKTTSFPLPPDCLTLSPGQVEADLVGGNLAVIAAHVGTPYQLKTKGKILLLETVDTQPYRIDRMLNQLKQAGMLDGIHGAILASWTNCLPGSPAEFTVKQVLSDYFCHAPYPVILGFPSGHVKFQVTLPLHCRYRLDATRRHVVLLEGGVSLRKCG